jgi:hypothetical protein
MTKRPQLKIPRPNTIKSLDTGIGNAYKKPQIMYTGTKLLGIGLRHKSGYEPVFSQEQARDLAQMRR